MDNYLDGRVKNTDLGLRQKKKEERFRIKMEEEIIKIQD